MDSFPRLNFTIHANVPLWTQHRADKDNEVSPINNKVMKFEVFLLRVVSTQPDTAVIFVELLFHGRGTNDSSESTAPPELFTGPTAALRPRTHPSVFRSSLFSDHLR